MTVNDEGGQVELEVEQAFLLTGATLKYRIIEKQLTPKDIDWLGAIVTDWKITHKIPTTKGYLMFVEGTRRDDGWRDPVTHVTHYKTITERMILRVRKEGYHVVND